jgi:carbamoyl-phosphate synthase small subunit
MVNAQTPVEDVLAMNPDGVFLSNGPGDPQPCDYAIKNIHILEKDNIPGGALDGAGEREKVGVA